MAEALEFFALLSMIVVAGIALGILLTPRTTDGLRIFAGVMFVFLGYALLVSLMANMVERLQ